MIKKSVKGYLCTNTPMVLFGARKMKIKLWYDMNEFIVGAMLL
jgi:hypothetical protein